MWSELCGLKSSVFLSGGEVLLLQRLALIGVLIMQVLVLLRLTAPHSMHYIAHIHYCMQSLHRTPQHALEIENITRPSPWNDRHLSVNADLCYEPRREGQ